MKRKRVFIPNSVLPPGSKRITNADNERVWLINGREFESKAAYFQFLKDAQLMAHAKSDGTAPAQDGSTAPPVKEIQSAASG